jgi:hypothetical protein
VIRSRAIALPGVLGFRPAQAFEHRRSMSERMRSRRSEMVTV